jgi:hypothetical protein
MRGAWARGGYHGEGQVDKQDRRYAASVDPYTDNRGSGPITRNLGNQRRAHLFSLKDRRFA